MYRLTLLKRDRVFGALFSCVLGIGLAFLLVLSSVHIGLAISTSDVPNPRQNSQDWVMDMADLLSPSSEAKLNTIITQLEAHNGAEIAVVTVPNTQGSKSPKAFATELFNQWGIGKKGIDNGLLFLISKGDRRTEIETGYGVEAVLPDAKVGEILRTQVTPQFKTGNFDEGIILGTQSLVTALETETFNSTSSLTQFWSEWTLKQALAALNGFPGSIFTLLVMSVSIWGGQRIGHNQKEYLDPLGKTLCQDRPNFLFGVQWLAGEDQSKRVEEKIHFIDASTQQNVSYRVLSPPVNLFPNIDKKLSAAFRFGCCKFIVISMISVYGLHVPSWSITLLVWAWLGLEIFWTTLPLSTMRLRHTGDKLFWATGMTLLLTATSYIVTINVFNRFLPAFDSIQFLLTSCLGGWVSALSLRRSLITRPIIPHCQQCQQLMEHLNLGQLKRRLSKVEKTSWHLGSCIYEGWQCASCSQGQRESELDFHLFYQVVKPLKFKYCDDCEGYTIEKKQTTIHPSTYDAVGEKLVTSHCACCNNSTEETQVIPRRVHIHSTSGSSGYSGGGGYGGGGGSSSGGGGFGGGSSGGGGGGASW